jgi:RNA polymerase sigma-70 factor, ECF subfamily
MPTDDFEQVVSECYEPLYRFAFSLARTEADAGDLTQQAFYILATKAHQLRDRSKIKSWLFTILHRQFLNGFKKAMRFQHCEVSETNEELLAVLPECVDKFDAAQVLEFLGQVPELYRAAVSLHYLEDYSYQEIAAILEVPLGTVRSRIARGIKQLQQLVLANIPTKESQVNRKPGSEDSREAGDFLTVASAALQPAD